MSVRVARFAVAGSIALVGCLTLPSGAAVTNSCVVLRDTSGDSRVGPVGTNDDGLDITSVTLSTDGTNALIALQVKDLASGTQTGRTWDVTFGNLESYFTVEASQELDGLGFALYGPGRIDGQPPLAQIGGSVDSSRSRVSFSVPFKAMHTTSSFGARDFRATTGRAVGTSGQRFKSGPFAGTGLDQPEATTVVYDEGTSQTKYSFKHGCDGKHY